MKQDRYLRHSLIDWFSQEELTSYHFAVVGCGAVGNEVAKNLALLGVGNLDLYDFDRIEVHNLTRSVLFRDEDVGRNKVEIAAQRIRELDPNISVQDLHGDFWANMSFETAAKYDCVFACVDNFEARLRLNQICQITSTNLVNTGIDSKFCSVEVFPFGIFDQVACFECNLPISAYQRIQNRYSCGWLKKISFVERKIPTTIMTSSITGALAVSLALNMLRDSSEGSSHKVLLNTFTGMSSLSKFERSSNCSACNDDGANRILLKGTRTIETGKFPFDDSLDMYLTASEPILVQYFCKNCESESNERNDVFQKAGDFDSSLITCQKCGEETVVTDIRDRFSINELLISHSEKKLPCKFVKLENEQLTAYIELED